MCQWHLVPSLALQAAVFDASHTYRLKGTDKYLTIIEENGRRYSKAYLADRLDGEWKPVADTAEKPFAGWKNIRPAPGVESWTDNVSHGELIRDGYDQRLIVDPYDLRFVFQGMLEEDKSGRGYGQFQWRIGMLKPAEGSAAKPRAPDSSDIRSLWPAGLRPTNPTQGPAKVDASPSAALPGNSTFKDLQNFDWILKSNHIVFLTAEVCAPMTRRISTLMEGVHGWLVSQPLESRGFSWRWRQPLRPSRPKKTLT